MANLNKTKHKHVVSSFITSIGHVFNSSEFDRLKSLMFFGAIMVSIITIRLFILQIKNHNFYTVLASEQHNLQAIIQPDRGDIFFQDQKVDDNVLAVTDKSYYELFANPLLIENPQEVTDQLKEYTTLDEETLLFRLSKENDPFESLEKKVSKERFLFIKDLGIKGIFGREESYRYYLDDNLGSHILGFVGIRDNNPQGLYGIEGYFDSILSGTTGYFESEKDIAGRWIALSDKTVQNAEDGSDIVLTIDRTLQFKACDKLNKALVQYDAEGGALIIMEPETGKILAMCSAPDFNPNYYSKVPDSSLYNNKSTFVAYEPGSIFKPIAMAAALDMNFVTPDTTYLDEGSKKIDRFTIRNADSKVYGIQTMTGVLENSINTGMIHIANLLGTNALRDYVQRFGFGETVGITLDSESPGNISSLNKKSEIFRATASFGQGITATPIQMVAAYSAIANGGVYMKPYIVDQIIHPNGDIDQYNPEVLRQVISSRTSLLLGSMLVSVVNKGHAGRAGVDGYYIAGKTGTAQIANPAGGYYKDQTNHSFVGYGPVDNPKFAMIVKLEKPKSARFSSGTAASVFGEMASFLLDYYDIEPDF